MLRVDVSKVMSLQEQCHAAIYREAKWQSQAVTYISECEHQDGIEFWEQFNSPADAVDDFRRYCEGMDLRSVTTFVDQDECRTIVSNLVAKATEDILYVLDQSTGPEGEDYIDEPPDPEVAARYAAFREFFAPNVISAIQAHVVGPLLAGVSVDPNGRLYLADTDKRERFNPVGDRLRSRVAWLCSEIPSLISHFHQLEGEELVQALDAVDSALGLDIDTNSGRMAAVELLPVLEQWYTFSQNGAKLLRGDKKTVDLFLSGLDAARDRLRKLESDRDTARANLNAGTTTEHDQEANLTELARVDGLIARYERRLSDLEEKRNVLVREVS